MYATDRQIIERLLVPALVQVILIGMQQAMGEGAKVLDPIKALLGEALREPVASIAPDRVGKLIRRAKRVAEQGLVPVAGKILAVQYLSVAHFAANLTAADVIAVGAESVFARAWDMLGEVIGFGEGELEQNTAEAKALSHEMSKIFAEMGVYRI